MLTKSEFENYINFIKEKTQLQTNLCVALEALSEGSYCDAFIYQDYETKLLELIVLNLAEGFGRPGDIDNKIYDDITYFMYEKDYGESFKLGDITIGGKQYLLKNAGDLYDFLVECYGDKNA